MTAHVLFVDDEEPNLVVFEAVCGDEFPVLTASSAMAGLELMKEHEIGVVLTDQRMPGMTGIEMLDRGARRNRRSERRVIRDALAHGFCAY